MKAFLKAVLTVAAFTMNLSVVPMENVQVLFACNTHVPVTVLKIILSLYHPEMIWLVVLVLLYWFYKNKAAELQTSSAAVRAIAMLFSFFMVAGYSYLKTNTLTMLWADSAQVIKTILAFAGYAVFFDSAILWLYRKVDGGLTALKAPKSEVGIWQKGWERSPMLLPFAVLVLFWLPKLLAFYPGLFLGDTGDQMQQYYGVGGSYLHLISEDVVLTNHHPVLHTLWMGACAEIGTALFGSQNLGFFLYTVTQYLICALVIAYSVKRLRVHRVSVKILWGIVLFYGLIPWYSTYAVFATKDVIYSCFLLLYIVALLECVYSGKGAFTNSSKCILVGVAAFGLCMFKSNGIYTIVLTIPVLLWKYRSCWKRFLCIFIPVILLFVCWKCFVLPAFQITDGSIREAFSIPFQQTARYVRDYPQDVTGEERKAISAILDYDSLAERYNPVKSDYVKETYHQEATSADLLQYFKVWFLMFWKHPLVYLEATMNNAYGYFYFGEAPLRENFYFFSDSEMCMLILNNNYSDIFEFSHRYSPLIVGIRNIVLTYSEIFHNVPVLTVFMTAAFYSWVLVLLLGWIGLKKQKKVMIGVWPVVITLLITIAGPCNGIYYFRYMYPIAYCLPILLGWLTIPQTTETAQ